MQLYYTYHVNLEGDRLYHWQVLERERQLVNNMWFDSGMKIHAFQDWIAKHEVKVHKWCSPIIPPQTTHIFVFGPKVWELNAELHGHYLRELAISDLVTTLNRG